MPTGNAPADAVRTIHRRGGDLVMQERRLPIFVFSLALAVCAALTTTWQSARAESARLGKLGTVNFPTSAQSEEAQAHFLRGVAALHSF
jgi:hypothetical protein